MRKRFATDSTSSPFTKVEVVPISVMDMLRKNQCKHLTTQEQNEALNDEDIPLDPAKLTTSGQELPIYEPVPVVVQSKYGIANPPTSVNVIEEYSKVDENESVPDTNEEFVATLPTFPVLPEERMTSSPPPPRSMPIIVPTPQMLEVAKKAAQPKSFPCTKCSKSFTYKWKRDRHMRGTHMYSSDATENARKKWTRIEELKSPPLPPKPSAAQIKSDQVLKDAKVFKCSTCGEVFPKKWTRDKHVRSAHAASKKSAPSKRFSTPIEKTSPSKRFSTPIEKMDQSVPLNKRAQKRKQNTDDDEIETNFTVQTSGAKRRKVSGANTSKKMKISKEKKLPTPKKEKKPDSPSPKVSSCKVCHLTFANKKAMTKHVFIHHDKKRKSYGMW